MRADVASAEVSQLPVDGSAGAIARVPTCVDRVEPGRRNCRMDGSDRRFCDLGNRGRPSAVPVIAVLPEAGDRKLWHFSKALTASFG